MSERPESHTNFAYPAAAAWIVVPIAWGLQSLLEDDGGWEGFSLLGVLGWAALIAAGVLTLLVMLKVDVIPSRSRLRNTGIVAMGLGILITIPMFWAVPVWASLYGVAMVLFAISTRGERGGTSVFAGAMIVAVASLFALTALEVGTPDPTYGDYPIAWATSFTVAAVGGALGNILFARSGRLATEPKLRADASR